MKEDFLIFNILTTIKHLCADRKEVLERFTKDSDLNFAGFYQTGRI